MKMNLLKSAVILASTSQTLAFTPVPLATSKELKNQESYLLSLDKELVNSARVEFDLGLIDEGLGDHKAAIVHFEKARKLKPYKLAPYLHLYHQYIYKKDEVSLKNLLTIAEKELTPSDYEVLLEKYNDHVARNNYLKINKAYNLLKEKKYEEALKISRELYKENAKDPFILLYLAQAHEALGHPKRAIKYYHKAYRQQRSWHHLKFKVVQLHAQIKEYHQAIKELKKLLKAEPHNAYYYNYLAYLYNVVGEVDDSIQVQKQNLRFNQGNLAAYHNLERMLMQTEKEDDVLAYIEKALVKFPQDQELLASKITILIRQHRYFEALEESKKLTNKDQFSDILKEKTGVKIHGYVSDDEFSSRYPQSTSFNRDFETLTWRLVADKPLKGGHQLGAHVGQDIESETVRLTGVENFKVFKDSLGLRYSYKQDQNEVRVNIVETLFDDRSTGGAQLKTENKLEGLVFGRLHFGDFFTTASVGKDHYIERSTTEAVIKDLNLINASQNYQMNPYARFFLTQSFYDYEEQKDFFEYGAGLDYWLWGEVLLSNSINRRVSLEETTNYHLQVYHERRLHQRYSVGLLYDFDCDFNTDIISHRLDLTQRLHFNNLDLSLGLYGQKYYSASKDHDKGFVFSFSTTI